MLLGLAVLVGAIDETPGVVETDCDGVVLAGVCDDDEFGVVVEVQLLLYPPLP